MVLILAPGHAGLADDGEGDPERVLAEKGLERVGERLVLAVEAEAMRDLPEASQAVTVAEAAHRKAGEAVGGEAGLPELRAQHATLRARLDRMNLVIRQMPGKARRNPQQNAYVAERDRLSVQVSNLGFRIRTAQANQADAAQRGQAMAEAERLRNTAAARVAELLGELEAVEQSYIALRADEAVGAAVAALNQGSRDTLVIGPSERFVQALGWAKRVSLLIGPPEEEDEAPRGNRGGRGASAANQKFNAALRQLEQAAALLDGLAFAEDDPRREPREAARVATLGLVNEAIEAHRREQDPTEIIARAIASHETFGTLAGLDTDRRRALNQARARLAQVQGMLAPGATEATAPDAPAPAAPDAP